MAFWNKLFEKTKECNIQSKTVPQPDNTTRAQSTVQSANVSKPQTSAELKAFEINSEEDLCIDSFRQIREGVSAFNNQLCNRFRILHIILAWQMIIKFPAAFHMKRIHEYRLHALHATGAPSNEYLGMLALYALHRSVLLFSDEKESIGKAFKLARDNFDPFNMSDNLVRCLTDILNAE